MNIRSFIVNNGQQQQQQPIKTEQPTAAPNTPVTGKQNPVVWFPFYRRWLYFALIALFVPFGLFFCWYLVFSGNIYYKKAGVYTPRDKNGTIIILTGLTLLVITGFIRLK